MAYIRTFTVGLAVGVSTLAMSAPAMAQGPQPLLGEIIYVGANFCPRGYASTSGQTLSIAQNTALFALLGTTYGGNGQTTFQLPDLRGRTAIHNGQGAGLTAFSLGETAGTETVTLTTNNLPKHDHRGAIQTANAQANATTPAGNAFGISSNESFEDVTPPASNFMDRTMVQVQPAGASQPISTLQPYIAITTCIAIEGIFPSRN